MIVSDQWFSETLLKSPPSLSAEPDNGAFWRVVWGPSDHDIILAGDRGVIHTDKRVSYLCGTDRSMTYFSLRRIDSVIFLRLAQAHFR